MQPRRLLAIPGLVFLIGFGGVLAFIVWTAVAVLSAGPIGHQEVVAVVGLAMVGLPFALMLLFALRMVRTALGASERNDSPDRPEPPPE